MMLLKPVRKLSQKGFTFVEMLITIGLLGIFVVILVTIFTATIDTQGQTEGYSATVSDGRFMMARLNYDLARASAITTPASAGSSGNTLVLTISSTAYTYTLSSGNLQLTVGANTDNLNSSGATVTCPSNCFQRVGNGGTKKDTIRYNLTLTSTAKHASGQDQQIFTSTVELR